MQVLSKIKGELAEGRVFLQFGILAAFGQGLGMLTPLIIAKFLTPALMGNYYLTKTAVFFFTTQLLYYMQTPFVVFANQEKEKSGKINKSFSVLCAFYAFSLTVFLLLIVSGSKKITDFAKIPPADIFIVIAAFAGIAMKTFICDLFLALGQRMKNALAEFVFGSVILICIITLCLTGSVNLKTVFSVYFVAGLLVLIVFIKGVDFRLLTPFLFDRQQFRDTIAFAKWVFIGATASYFISWGNDNIVLRFNTSTSNIGTYNLGCDIYRSILMLIFLIYIYFLPFVSQHIQDRTKIHEYLWRKRPRIFFVGLAVISLIFIFAPFAFRIVYQNVYEGSAAVLRILLIAAALALYNIFYEVVFNSLKKYKVTQTVNVLHVLLNLILNIVLVPIMGIKGTAVATVISYAARVVIYETYFRTKIKPGLHLSN
ncbi:MAG: polysaccharide biosynthesis C-terminal domain-containing protein [Sedimentisphaerales bacterium]